MSFFDDDEPPTRNTRTASRPRRRSAGGRGGSGSLRPGDQQQLMIRRAVALGVIVIVLILIVVGVNSCRNSAHKSSLRDYDSSVAQLASQSSTQVSRPLFQLLSGNGGSSRSPVTLETQINQYRVVAEDQARRAKNLSVPGEVADAQRSFVLLLDLRAEAVGAIASKIRAALGSAAAATAANQQIAGQMEKLLASDVLYSQRVVPLVREALSSQDVTGQPLPASRFLPNLGWLEPSTVASRLGSSAGGGAGGQPTTPGPHGHGLVSTSVAGTTLQPNGAVNRISVGTGLTFTVSFQNQGASAEHDVNVRIQINGAGTPITVSKTVPQTNAGQTVQAEIPLGRTPPIGTPVDVVVTVGKVPGEQLLDNNTSTYTTIFTR